MKSLFIILISSILITSAWAEDIQEDSINTYYPSNEISSFYSSEGAGLGVNLGIGAALKEKDENNKDTIIGANLGHWDMNFIFDDDNLKLESYNRDILHIFTRGTAVTDGGLFSLREFNINDSIRFQNRSTIKIDSAIRVIGNKQDIIDLNVGAKYGKSFSRKDYFYGVTAQVSFINGLIDLRGDFTKTIGKVETEDSGKIERYHCYGCSTAETAEYRAILEIGERFGGRGEIKKLKFHERKKQNSDIDQDRFKIEAFFKF